MPYKTSKLFQTKAFLISRRESCLQLALDVQSGFLHGGMSILHPLLRSRSAKKILDLLHQSCGSFLLIPSMRTSAGQGKLSLKVSEHVGLAWIGNRHLIQFWLP